MSQNGKDSGDIADEVHVLLCRQSHIHPVADATAEEHSDDALCQITDERQRSAALSETAQGVGQAGIVAAKIPHILMFQQPNHKNGAVAASQQIRHQRRQNNCQKQHSIHLLFLVLGTFPHHKAHRRSGQSNVERI